MSAQPRRESVLETLARRATTYAARSCGRPRQMPDGSRVYCLGRRVIRVDGTYAAGCRKCLTDQELAAIIKRKDARRAQAASRADRQREIRKGVVYINGCAVIDGVQLTLIDTPPRQVPRRAA